MPASSPARDLALGKGDDRLHRIGADLRAARLARGEELDCIADWLCIKPAHLAAIEDGDLAATPGRVYAMGFVRTYADHLGLDGSAYAARLRAVLEVAHDPHSRTRTGRLRFPAAASIAAVLILTGAGVVGYTLIVGKGPSILAGPDATEPAAIDAASASAAEAPPIAILASLDDERGGRAARAPVASGRIILVGRAPSWIRLSDPSGDFVRSWSVGPGDWIPVPPQRGLALSTGDAGSIEILVDGRSVGLAGPPAGILRGLTLDPDALLARMPAS